MTSFGALTHSMTLFHKRLLLVLVALATGIFAFVQSVNILVTKNREQVYQELQKLLGTKATFETLDVNLWGGPGFSATEFRIADNPRFAATPLLHAAELRLGVSVLQLLLGKVVINSLTFKNPEFQIITNEEGLLNLSALGFDKSDFREIPKSRLMDKKHPAVNFLVTRIRLRDGRVHFFDRSLNEPAEIQIKNINMDLNGLDPTRKTELRLTAALTEGLRRDVRIAGEVGPIQHGRSWSQQPVDLEMQFDSLYVPMLARALPFVRNKIPRELDVTGPMSLHTNLTGSFDRPKFTAITLNVPCFGSPDYNAVLTGTMELPESRSWDKTQLEGKLTIDPISLTNLRIVPIVKEVLPANLATEGSMSVYSRFEGSWERLRIGALIKADKSELRFRDWFRKPAGDSARILTKLSREKNGVVLHPSELHIGNSTMTLSGTMENMPGSRLRLQMRTGPSKIADWGHLISPLGLYGMGGSVNWDLVLEKNFAFADETWSVQGKLELTDAELRDKTTGKRIDQLNASVSFLGKEARLETASFRLGSSRFAMTADAVNFFTPSAKYQLSSPELNPSDLPVFPAGIAGRIKDLTATGEMRMQDGALFVQASIASPTGTLQRTSYRNLQADVAWSPAGARFRNLILQTLNGTVRSDGSWEGHADGSKSFEVASQMDSLDVQTLLTRIFPELSHRMEGELNFAGRFNATARDGRPFPAELKGAGETGVQHGKIKDFNLFSQFFSRANEPSASSNISSVLPASLTALLDQRDTFFENLEANFTVEARQIRSSKLSLSTPDYTINANGWIGFDGQTKWNGSLVLAPRLVQELQRENKMIRYLLDRRGKLSMSFRIEGRFPNVKLRPENRALAQALRLRSSQRINEPPSGGEKDPNKRERGGWPPQSLNRLSHR
jgi:hypothetical protein